MKSLLKFLLTFLLIFSAGAILYSQNISVKGKLLDKETGSAISNGTITFNPGNRPTVTNGAGEYFFTSTPGTRRLSSQVLGYKPVTIEFTALSDTIIDIYLQVLPFELEEVTVTGTQVNSVRVTQHGAVVITPAAMRETPRIFSEPDLLKSLQLMPGVVGGKDGSSDIYVRGGGSGQNIILANGCYFFLPAHFLGMISPIDIDFLESSELYKDYFPAELGGGAGSVLSLRFKDPHSDSLHAQLRLGMLSSGITVELPVRELNLNITAGIKRGNYSLYLPYMKKIVSEDVSEYLPEHDYKFYDGFFKISHSSPKLGTINYLFFGNYDNGNQENELSNLIADTLFMNLDRVSNQWHSVVHALEWLPRPKGSIKWKVDLNYNRILIGRESFHQAKKYLFGTVERIETISTSYAFKPSTDIIGSTVSASQENEKISWTGGITTKLRYFTPGIAVAFQDNDRDLINYFGEDTRSFEPAAFASASYRIAPKLLIDAGLRFSGAFLKNTSFVITEPRARLAYNPDGKISPHITYVRLSQFDHSIEGTSAGLRSVLWLPVSKEYGPEITDVVSAGFQGRISNDFILTADGYYKKITGMNDYKSGASFVYDTTFSDLLDVLDGRAYGLEVGLIKYTGNITGSFSYTYSRSHQEWGAPGGLIWIPSNADRPHNLNLAVRYHFKKRTSFGLNWVYQSGVPATIYMHETSYGKFFNQKNNIRYYDYNRMDLSIRHIIYKRKYSVSLDADIYNLYNYKNTFYFKETHDGFQKKYYYKNVTLFPIMPTLTVTIKY
jgi:hypothetical protein